MSPEEAQRRLSRYGPNVLEEPGHYSLIRGFLRQFTHFLAMLLWIAVALAFTAEFMKPGEGMATLGWAILGVIVINAVFAFFQEYKAERAVHALHRLLPAKAWVLRSDNRIEVSRSEIVPGDVLMLEEGEQISADARLIEAAGMRVDNLLSHRRIPTEAADSGAAHGWTSPGHSQSRLRRHPDALRQGRAVVFATGMQTEFGKIARLTTSGGNRPQPAAERNCEGHPCGRVLSVAMGGSFSSSASAMGLGFWISAIFGIGIIVANVPEGLLPTVTLALAIGQPAHGQTPRAHQATDVR